MLSFIWPAYLMLPLIAWAAYVNLKAAFHAHRHEPANTDIFYLRLSVGGAALYFFFANLLRWLSSLTAVQYLGLVSPITPVIYLVVWGLPAWLYLRRSRITQETFQEELKKIEEQVPGVTEGIEK